MRQKLRVSLAAKPQLGLEITPKQAAGIVAALILGFAAVLVLGASWMRWGEPGAVLAVLGLAAFAGLAAAILSRIKSLRLDFRERTLELNEKSARTEYLRAQALGISTQARVNYLQANRVTLSPGQIWKDLSTRESIYCPGNSAKFGNYSSNNAPTVDIPRECLSLGRAYAIIGGQQLGKTHVARAIAAEWVRAERQVLLLSPKWNPGDWPNWLPRLGPEFTSIGQGLEMVRELAIRRRHESIARGVPTQSFPPCLVIVDDATEVIASLGDTARRFVISATTMFASVNLIPLFTIHADTSAAWGVDRIGKALTSNFLRVIVHRDSESQRRLGVLWPGEVERRVEGRLVYPRYGRIGGEIHWPGEHPPQHPGEHTTRHSGEPRGNSANPSWYVHADMPPFTDGEEPRALPNTAPARIRVFDERGRARIFRLSVEGCAQARRAYEETRSLNKCLAAVDITGSRQVRVGILRAMLGIPGGWELLP